MDSYEATKIVFTRIQNLDPENASKIMGYILIQDHGDKEMIRLALATDTLLHSLILKAKTHLRLSSSVSSSPKLLQPLPSYASVVNGQKTTNDNHPLSPSALPFYIEDHLSFLNDSKCEQQQQDSESSSMFDFVTFIYPETVKLILGKGNPHFVCDSRVLVKPYKEKGKVAEKKLQQQIERGNYSACSSPVGLDSREPFDFHLGARMLYNQQEMLLRRNLEERADLQHAMEVQGRRLMKLQVLDFNNPANRYHHHNGSPIPSPHTPNNHQSLMFQLDGIDRDLYEENKGTRDSDDKQEVNPSCNHNNGSPNTSDDNKNVKFEEGNPQESLEHILPDNLFASPKKSAGDHQVTMFSATTESDGHKLTSNNTNNNPLVPSSETVSMPTFKSCFLQTPQLSSGHGTINGM